MSIRDLKEAASDFKNLFDAGVKAGVSLRRAARVVEKTRADWEKLSPEQQRSLTSEGLARATQLAVEKLGLSFDVEEEETGPVVIDAEFVDVPQGGGRSSR